MLIVFDFDPETGEYTPVSREIINEGETGAKKTETKSTSKKKSKSSLPDSKEPLIVLEDNKDIQVDDVIESYGFEAKKNG